MLLMLLARNNFTQAPPSIPTPTTLRPFIVCVFAICTHRLKQQLLAEQQRNASLQVAVRSVQRSQAAAANAYLAGVIRPDSPPAVAGASLSQNFRLDQDLAGLAVAGRPAGALAACWPLRPQGPVLERTPAAAAAAGPVTGACVGWPYCSSSNRPGSAAGPRGSSSKLGSSGPGSGYVMPSTKRPQSAAAATIARRAPAAAGPAAGAAAAGFGGGCTPVSATAAGGCGSIINSSGVGSGWGSGVTRVDLGGRMGAVLVRPASAPLGEQQQSVS
jgi:hypothetical protein